MPKRNLFGKLERYFCISAALNVYLTTNKAIVIIPIFMSIITKTIIIIYNK